MATKQEPFKHDTLQTQNFSVHGHYSKLFLCPCNWKQWKIRLGHKQGRSKGRLEGFDTRPKARFHYRDKQPEILLPMFLPSIIFLCGFLPREFCDTQQKLCDHQIPHDTKPAVNQTPTHPSLPGLDHGHTEKLWPFGAFAAFIRFWHQSHIQFFSLPPSCHSIFPLCSSEFWVHACLLYFSHVGALLNRTYQWLLLCCWKKYRLKRF